VEEQYPETVVEEIGAGGSAEVQGFDQDELQMLFEVHTGKYVTIHEFETNVTTMDSVTYYDKNAI